MRRIFRGLGFNLTGFKYLAARPRLWKFIVIPLIINLFILTLLMSVYVSYFNTLFGFLSGWLGGIDIAAPAGFWETLLDGFLWFARGLVQILFFVLSVVLIFLAVFLVSSIINSPFYEALSERILILEGRRAETDFLWGNLVRSSVYAVRTESLKAVVLFSVSAMLTLLSLIPLAGLIFAVLNFLFVAFTCAFGLASLPLSIERARLRDILGWAWRHKLLLIGFGLPALIPFLGLFLAGLQVPGGTLLFLHTRSNPAT